MNSSLIFAVLLVLSVISAVAAQWPANRCTSSALNVRSGPSTGYGVQTTLSSGSSITVYDKTSDGWAKIGDSRYVSAQYLTSCSTQAMCATTAVNIRSGPGTGYGVIRTASNGEQFSVRGSAVNGFHNVNDAQWVSAQYLGNCGGGGGGGGGSTGKSKEAEALKEILGSEGRCQNWSQDSGNWMNGNLGYTCAGIIPSVGYNARSWAFSYAVNACSGVAAEMFVKCAWDRDENAFIQGASAIYSKNYFQQGGCSPLPQPAFYVCADIAVNSGPGRSSQYLGELGPIGSDVKSYAHRLNDRHRTDYKKWGAPGNANNRFLAGWLARADARDRYIDNY